MDLLFDGMKTVFSSFLDDYATVLSILAVLAFYPIAIRLITGAINSFNEHTNFNGLFDLRTSDEEMERAFNERNSHKGSWRYDLYNRKYQRMLGKYENENGMM